MNDGVIGPYDNIPPYGFMVGVSGGDKINIMAFNRQLTKPQALNLAAWLVTMADPDGEEFKKYLHEVQSG